MEQSVFTIPDVARIVKVSEKTITRMLQKGSFSGFRMASQWRFHPEDCEHWLKAKKRQLNGSTGSRIDGVCGQESETLPIPRLTALLRH